MSVEEEVVVVAETRRHSLLRDGSGYAIWDDRTDDEEPLAEFPLTDEGMDDAFDELARLGRAMRRDRVMAISAWVTVGFGVVWLVDVAILMLFALAGALFGPDTISQETLQRIYVFSYPVAFLPQAFLVAIGVYVVLWTRMRSRRGKD